MINVWIRNRTPNWKISWDIGNLYLSLLVAYKLKKNWNANIRLVTVVDNDEQEVQAGKFMAELIDQARLTKTETLVHIGTRPLHNCYTLKYNKLRDVYSNKL